MTDPTSFWMKTPLLHTGPRLREKAYFGNL
jgi:hypothetical protein